MIINGILLYIIILVASRCRKRKYLETKQILCSEISSRKKFVVASRKKIVVANHCALV
jgi:hypothetical protein